MEKINELLEKVENEGFDSLTEEQRSIVLNYIDPTV